MIGLHLWFCEFARQQAWCSLAAWRAAKRPRKTRNDFSDSPPITARTTREPWRPASATTRKIHRRAPHAAVRHAPARHRPQDPSQCRGRRQRPRAVHQALRDRSVAPRGRRAAHDRPRPDQRDGCGTIAGLVHERRKTSSALIDGEQRTQVSWAAAAEASPCRRYTVFSLASVMTIV